MTGKTGQPKRIGGSNQLMTMREAAAYLHVSYERFCEHYRDDWGLVPVMLDSRPRFRERDIVALIEQRMT